MVVISIVWICCYVRAFVVVMVVISIVWIPVIEQMQGGQLYIYIQSICAYLAPPIAAVYCMSLLWTRANEKVSSIGSNTFSALLANKANLSGFSRYEQIDIRVLSY